MIEFNAISLVILVICSLAVGSTIPWYYQRYVEWKMQKEKEARGRLVAALTEALTSLPHRLQDIETDVELDGVVDEEPSPIIDAIVEEALMERVMPDLTEEEMALAAERKSGAVSPPIPSPSGLIKKG